MHAMSLPKLCCALGMHSLPGLAGLAGLAKSDGAMVRKQAALPAGPHLAAAHLAAARLWLGHYSVTELHALPCHPPIH